MEGSKNWGVKKASRNEGKREVRKAARIEVDKKTVSMIEGYGRCQEY